MQLSGFGCFVIAIVIIITIITTTATTTIILITVAPSAMHPTYVAGPPLKFTPTAKAWTQSNATGPPASKYQPETPLKKTKPTHSPHTLPIYRAQVAAVVSGLDFINLARL
jgi:hypothetical protein